MNSLAVELDGLLAEGCRNVCLVLKLTSLKGSIFLAASGGESVYLCVCCDWMLFFFFAVRLELQTRPVCAPSAAALNGEHQQRLSVWCRPDRPALTDKPERFGQQQSCTIQMLISHCRVVPRCLLLRFDWILPQDPTWPNQIPTAYL